MTSTRGIGERDIVVVDGSNIATEGRARPSLAQLNDAVMAFMEEHPEAMITVVVDATFGHRIEPSEVKEFDIGVANNELVTPPAGAIGRGDAFVLSIADKVDARILSNDSFQEFHGQYDWLFDEGRLIGGKPVPHVGWVFVERLPVRGATSRRSERAVTTRRTGRAKKVTGPTTTAAQERAARTQAMADGRLPPAPPGASGAPVEQPDAVPRAGSRRTARAAEREPAAVSRSRTRRSGAQRDGDEAASGEDGARQRAPEPVNDTLPFIEFAEKHPVGTSVNAVVESYSSHGAYVTVDDIRGYVPLHLIDDPPPRSARTVMAIGDALTLVVASYSPARRSVDLAFPALLAATGVVPSDAALDAAPTTTRRGRRAAASDVEAAVAEIAAVEAAVAETAATEAAVSEVAVSEAVVSEAAVAAGVVAVEEPETVQPAVRKRAAKKAVAEPTADTATVATSSRATRSTTPAAPKSSAAKVPVVKKRAAKKPATTGQAAEGQAATGRATKESTAETAVVDETAPAMPSAGKKAAGTKAAGKQAAGKQAAGKTAASKAAASKKAAGKKAAGKTATAATGPVAKTARSTGRSSRTTQQPTVAAADDQPMPEPAAAKMSAPTRRSRAKAAPVNQGSPEQPAEQSAQQSPAQRDSAGESPVAQSPAEQSPAGQSPAGTTPAGKPRDPTGQDKRATKSSSGRQAASDGRARGSRRKASSSDEEDHR